MKRVTKITLFYFVITVMTAIGLWSFIISEMKVAGFFQGMTAMGLICPLVALYLSTFTFLFPVHNLKKRYLLVCVSLIVVFSVGVICTEIYYGRSYYSWLSDLFIQRLPILWLIPLLIALVLAILLLWVYDKFIKTKSTRFLAKK